MTTITIDKNLDRNNGKYYVFGTYEGEEDRYVFGVRQFSDKATAEKYAGMLMKQCNTDRLACRENEGEKTVAPIPKRLTPQEAIDNLNGLNSDPSDDHIEADAILCAALRYLGQDAVIAAYEKARDRMEFGYSPC